MDQELKKAYPIVSVSEDGAINGLRDKYMFLVEELPIEVENKEEAKIAKGKVASWRNDKKEISSARTKLVKMFKEQTERQYPEMGLIDKAATELIEDQLSKINPFNAAIKKERLKKAQNEADSYNESRGWKSGELELPHSITNEEYWTEKGNLTGKGRNLIKSKVNEHELELTKTKAKLDADERRQESLMKTILEILDGIDVVNGIYSGPDVINMMKPLKAFLTERTVGKDE